MCIIFYNEKGKPYDREEISIAYDNNPHGVGLMWVEKGKVRTIRGLFSKDKLYNILEQFEGVPHALHLRWRTRGKISKELCHPFRASHSGSNKSVYLMHNGTIFGINPKDGQSDTHVFARKMQEATFRHGTDTLFQESFLRRVEKNIKSYNKVIFLRDDGKVAIMNPESWTVKGGIWYSNTYSLSDGYRKAKVARETARFIWSSKKQKKKKRKERRKAERREQSYAGGSLTAPVSTVPLTGLKPVPSPSRGSTVSNKEDTDKQAAAARPARRVVRRRRHPEGGYIETVIRT